ncbi:MAG TPA: SusD/RagB family nutrient-binding outer membrane lipoprotein, partial [Nitrosopumilaceae archaeon]|nr:SusD/RagB family nutrient-binding outer membrane lipoprotein [Nitrosopumilaceae archaeon]
LNDEFSKMGIQYFLPQLGGSNPPMGVMSAAEVYFLRAEGALRGWQMGGTDMELYNEGITTSLMDRTNASSITILNYINSNATPIALNDTWNTPAMSNIPVSYEANGSLETRLEQIITQKWIALYPDGWEAWAERRRTGYPLGYPLIESLDLNIPANGMMRRLVFTLSEIQNNLEAVKAARLMLNGPDVNQTRLWWDAKP